MATNVITWDLQGQDDILWEYPDDRIRVATVLVVNEWQWAVFMRDGQILRVFEAGKYELTTANFPFLTKLLEKAGGYKDGIFKAKVIFVSKKQFQGKWGVRAMVKVAQDYQAPVPLMGNGDYTYRIDSPELFITQLVAGTKNFSTAGVKQFMQNFVSEPIMQQLSKQYYLDVFENLEKASLITKTDLEDDFKNRGLELLAFKIGGVSTEEKYQEDIYKFQQFRSSGGTQGKLFGVMEHMADAIGESQGGAAMGAGMMLFPQMYQQMSQQGGGLQPQQQPKVLCPYCGQPNDYPYRFCGNCGQPSPQQQPQQPPAAQPAAQPAPAPAPAGGGAPKAFKRCPYCGEDLSGLPKTPKFCPYCSEQLN